jgi:hypothetical protein
MPPALATFFLALLFDYACAAAIYPFIAVRGGRQVFVITVAMVVLIASPMLIPADHVQLRAAAIFLAVDLCLRIVDFARHCRRVMTMRPSWRTFLRFLIPFPTLLVVFNLRGRHPTQPIATRRELVRFVAALSVFSAAISVTYSLRTNVLLREFFLLDHAAKLVLFVFCIESLSQCLLGLERLAGFDTTPIIDRAYLARSPAEFWHRYNQRVRWWLTLNVFRPTGGLRAPARGIWATFVVSALLHEVAFGIATSCFDGYQALFFLLQAPAVIASRPLERLANRSIAGDLFARLVTLLWLASTSMLFFRGVDRVFPFVYAGEPWLP